MVELNQLESASIAIPRNIQCCDRPAPNVYPAGNLRWSLPPEELCLEHDEIHVWAARLDPAPAELLEYSATLTPEEHERAARFYFMRDRNRFIAGRGLLRALLGCYVGAPPEQLRFVYGPAGKPSLARPFAMAGLEFNLAHSEDLALLGITRGGALGVDIERVQELRDAEQLVARFFSTRESTAFRALSAELRPAAFFNLWTRKEAWLKATGEGIAHSLNRVEVSFLPGEQAQLLSIAGSYSEAIQWELQELSPAPGFVGAVAVGPPGKQVKCWQWAREA